MNLITFLLIGMTAAAILAVMGRSLLKATIALAMTSAILTILMFTLDSPIAAVFELSVCTGLITVVFVSTVSLTKPLTNKQIIEASKDRFRRFCYLPVIMVITGVLLIVFAKVPTDLKFAAQTTPLDVRSFMWNMRQLDMFGQIIIIIAGALGVATLFKERKNEP